MAIEHKMVLTAEIKDRITKRIQGIQKEIKQLDATAKRGEFGKAYERAGKQIELAKAKFQQFAQQHSAKIKQMASDVAKWGAGLTAGLVYGIKNLADSVKNLEQTRNTFNTLTATIGASTDAMERMRNATQGMVSDADLMEAGNKLISMGLAKTGEDMEKYTRIASKLGTAMGNDATASLENFSLMLANQSILRLDSFGISSGKVRERIAELTQGVNAVDRETAFMTATMEQAEISMKKLGDAPLTSGQKMQVAQAKIANLKNEIAERMIPVMANLYESVTPIITKISDWINNNRELFTSLVIFTTKTLATITVVAGLGLAVAKLTTAYAGLKAIITSGLFKGFIKTITSVITGTVGATGATFTFSGAIASMKVALAGAMATAKAFLATLLPLLPAIVGIGAVVGGAVWAFKEWNRDTRELAEAQKNLQQAQQNSTNAMNSFKQSIGAFNTELANHKDKIAGYQTQLNDLAKQTAKIDEQFNQKKGDAKTELAKKFVEAEEKVKTLTTEITEKQESLRKEISKRTQDEITKSQRESINERIAKLKEEIEEKQSQKAQEMEALQLESGMRKIVEEQIAEVKRRNSLTELQRAVEDYTTKVKLLKKERDEQIKNLNAKMSNISSAMKAENEMFAVKEQAMRDQQKETFKQWVEMEKAKLRMQEKEGDARKLDERWDNMNFFEKTSDVSNRALSGIWKGIARGFDQEEYGNRVFASERDKFIANNRTNLAEKKVEVHRMDMIINQKIDSQTDVDRLTTDIFDKLQKNLK